MAIIPAAGSGTRMASVTAGKPKELLRLGSRTVLERVIDEAIRAGADETIVVSSPNKPAIAETLEEWGRGRFREARIRLSYQEAMRGLADAVLHAPADGDLLVLLGDSAYSGGSPSERMANLVYRGIDGCIAVETVADDEVSRYGICEIDDFGTIRRLVEKPKPTETSSRWAVAGRYAFSAPAATTMRNWLDEALPKVPEGEISLTAAIQAAMAAGYEFKGVAVPPGQQRADCGSPEEYEAARRMNWD